MGDSLKFAATKDHGWQTAHRPIWVSATPGRCNVWLVARDKEVDGGPMPAPAVRVEGAVGLTEIDGWHRVDPADVPDEGRVRSVTVDGRSVALAWCGGRLGALENRCPHQGGPLGEGSIEKGWRLITGNEDGVKHCAMNVLYSLQHLGYAIPPQADAGWIGEAGPGPSYLDPGSGGPGNEFTNRNTTFMTWNLMHLARMLKDAGGFPAYGNQRSQWDAGCRFDYPNPDYR